MKTILVDTFYLYLYIYIALDIIDINYFIYNLIKF